jgi:hypothetical protein
MEISKDQFKDFIKRMLANFKAMELDIRAVRMVVAAMEITDPNDPLVPMIREMKKNPQLVKQLDYEYSRREENSLAAIEKLSADQALAEFLRSWTPEGFPN